MRDDSEASRRSSHRRAHASHRVHAHIRHAHPRAVAMQFEYVPTHDDGGCVHRESPGPDGNIELGRNMSAAGVL